MNMLSFNQNNMMSMQGNKTNLIEALRNRQQQQQSTNKSTQKLPILKHTNSKEELKKYLIQNPKTNLITLFKNKKKQEEDETQTPESAKQNKQKMLKFYEQGGLSPICAIQKCPNKSVSDESAKTLQIAIPKRQSLISPKLQQMSSLYSQNSILESPCEQESSFVVGASNASDLDNDQYFLRVEQIEHARITRSQSQISPNLVQPFTIESIKQQVPDQITSPGPNTLSVPSKQQQPRRLQSFSGYDRGQSTQTKQLNSAEQRKSVRLMRGLSGINQQAIETNVLERSKDEAGRKKMNNYVILHELGRGGFGKVRLVYHEEQQVYYAMKIADRNKLKRKLLTRDTSAYTLLEQEVAILKKVVHQNVVRLVEVIDDPEERKLYLIMEHVKKGSLNSKQYWKSEGIQINWDDGEKPPCIEMSKIRNYLRDFLLGLDYLHNYARIVHRDIKPDNLLIDENDQLKIADFGVAQIVDNSSTDLIQGEIGTKAFLPPESFKNQPVKGKPTDIWATGVTFYMITQGESPFPAKNVANLKDLVQNHEVTYKIGTDPLLIDFLNLCLRKDSRQRATLEQLMDHPFVTLSGSQPLLEQEFDQNFIISENEISKALSKVTLRATVRVFAKLKQQLNRSRQRIKSRTTMIK